ncbi:terminase TerL endonuclease subunit [Vagococcus lutrae]|uniref:terminase TerL endonuclease subunit n=1 Tax=Vagococcus lutrae TaxID=81947 RepID=UPI002891512A|nr:terminase TerL endonuclease subunit [Vagococcus lutrae]MDT2808376.1 terminase large subunit [Vagococcus lutrae]
MMKQKYVDEYINLYRTGKIKFNAERVQLVEYLEKYVLSRDDLYFDDEMIDNCIAFGEKWYFPLQPFQKFLIAFVFLFYKETDRNFYRKFLWMLGRGGGKNGLISVITHFLISELHGIEEYDISVIANSEDQAKTSPDEIMNTVLSNDTLKRGFRSTATYTRSKKTRSSIRYRTSNGDTKDGLRDGAVVFDEIHQYADNKDVRVHISGLGKRPNPREFYIGTDGYVREGFLDNQKEIAKKVLSGQARVNTMFPFICKLDEEEEVDDISLWEKANPMLSNPRSGYAENLYQTILEEYEDLEHDPSNREEFITKRMNLPLVDLEQQVATEEELMATNRPIPDLTGQHCIGSLDYGSVRDFAACGLLFRNDDEYYFITHSFVIKDFADKYYGYSHSGVGGTQKYAPIREWEEQGLLTVIDEPTLDPRHVINWFVEQRDKYYFDKIVADNYKLDILRPLFIEEGFEVETIRNPRAIHPLLAPRVEDGFGNHKFVFGDNPLMRWYTRNVYVKNTQNGKQFLKQEEVRRKTDGFQALIHALYRADDLTEVNMSEALDIFDSLVF